MADCAVLTRNTNSSNKVIIAYLVPGVAFTPDRLEARLKAVLPSQLLPSGYVPVSSIPLTPEGRVNEHALTALAVVDLDLLRRWDDQLRAVPAIERAIVRLEAVNECPSISHLSDLLPGWKTVAGASKQETVPARLAPDIARCATRVPAISHGGLLAEADGPATLAAALHRACLKSPEKGIAFVERDGSEKFQAYPDLLTAAQRVLAGLKEAALKPGDKVIFQLDGHRDFVATFWGCVLGGFVPVPIAVSTTYAEVNSTVRKLQNAWEMFERPLIVTSRALHPAVSSLSDLLNLDGLRVSIFEDLNSKEPDADWHRSQPHDLAILLLTSGSTGIPKAVMQSHQSLLHRSAASAQTNHFSSQEVSLNWFPLDHVGGIVMFHIRDVYLCCQQIQVQTEFILSDPLRWLDLIERHRVTVTWAPNFAYGLINSQAERVQARRRDLASLRFILNGGEAIVAKTARRFLELLRPHGLPATAMHPAWGMSETASGITYSPRFTLESTSDEDPFVEVGSPIPGISLRIVDAQNRLAEEGAVGSLQVKGASITSGYYGNRELNDEAFTEDGWFKTGDLGFLRDGRLTITGRDKDVIIINGANFYSHEIEAAVEEIAEVETSYTAACAVRDSSADTDQLAIFFQPKCSADNRVAELLRVIPRTLLKTMGINPAYLIPLPKEKIPKTSIGKIQRSQLSERFAAGEFDDVLKRVDILDGNANTLPDWFFDKAWRRREISTLEPQAGAGQSLVFVDQRGLGTLLCAELNRPIRRCVIVEAGSEFSRINKFHYRIDENNRADYLRLMQCLAQDALAIDQLLHLWTYDEGAGDLSNWDEIERSLARGVYSLLFLVQALNQAPGSRFSTRLYAVSNRAQPVRETEMVCCGKAAMLGLMKTVSQELPWIDCRHIDLPGESSEQDAAWVLRELQTVHREKEVAYRGGERWVARLRKLDMRRETILESPVKKNGMYLVSGGLGGIGLEISKYLLKYYGAKLLLLGRTSPAEKGIAAVASEKADLFSQRRLALEAMGGEVIYEPVDVCNFQELEAAVRRAENRWQGCLDGVIHLAGVYRENPIVNETRDSLAALLRPKVLGTWTLHQLRRHRPDMLFIHFSSVNGFFGGANVGAYAAANSFLDAFSHCQRYETSRRTYCFSWSMWDEIGMSRNYPLKELTRARGYYALSAAQGLHSFLVGLHHGKTHLFVGLNDGNREIRKYIEPARPLQKITAYWIARSDQPGAAEFRKCLVGDRFGTATTCEFVQLETMPLTSDGEIDMPLVAAGGASAERRAREPIAPRTELERRIAVLWQEVFAAPQFSIHDNFFDAGGDSLMAMRLLSRLREVFSVDMSLRRFFEVPTVAELAAAIGASTTTEKTLPY